MDLVEDRRLIVVSMGEERPILHSPAGPLSREQLELIDVQGNSARLHALLPDKAIKVGDSWPNTNNALKDILGLDAIAKSDVKSRLVKIEAGVAKLEMSGSLEGAIDGVSSTIQINSKYSYNIQQGRITWFALAVKEKRSIGHASPGFEVTARLRMAIELLEESPQLEDPLLEEVPLTIEVGSVLLEHKSPKGEFAIMHDRRWHPLSESGHVTVLRMIDRGELVAQCNISRLPDLPAGKHIQIEELQTDIQKGAHRSFRSISRGLATNDRDRPARAAGNCRGQCGRSTHSVELLSHLGRQRSPRGLRLHAGVETSRAIRRGRPHHRQQFSFLGSEAAQVSPHARSRNSPGPPSSQREYERRRGRR